MIGGLDEGVRAATEECQFAVDVLVRKYLRNVIAVDTRETALKVVNYYKEKNFGFVFYILCCHLFL